MLQISELESCKIDVKYSAPSEMVKKNRNEVAKEFKKENIPGFRPGKAPAGAIKHHFKNQIDDGLKQKMAQEAYDSLLAEKNLRPFGGPQFTSLSLENDNFDCSFVLHTVPEFELKKYKGFDIPKGNVPSSTEMSEKLLENLRNQFGETVPFKDDDFVQEGNSVIMNIMAKNDKGEEVLRKDAELFTIGNAPFEAINSNILGMKIGDKRNFGALVLDENEFKNQNLQFEVELTMGSKSVPHPIDEDLAKKMEVESLEVLRTLVQSAAESRIKTHTQRHLFDQISARLVEEHQFDLPDWLVLAEARTLAKQYDGEWEAVTDERKEEFLSSARNSVRFSLVLDKIRQEEPDAQLSEEETMQMLRGKVKEANPEQPEAEVLKNLLEGGKLQMLLTALKDEHTIDFIINNSNIVE